MIWASSAARARFDAQGVIAGSRDANRCIGYLTKYLTKHVADCHQARTTAQHEHTERLADALRYEPCSPTCASWLRLPATDPSRYTWEPVTPGDPDHMPNAQRLLHVVADRQRWRAALTEARARASGRNAPELPAAGRAV